MKMKKKVLSTVLASVLALGSVSAFAADLDIKNKETGAVYGLLDYATDNNVFYDLATSQSKYLVESGGKWYDAEAAIKATQDGTSLSEAAKNLTPVEDVNTGDLKVESVSAINAKGLKVVFNKAIDTTKAEIAVKRDIVNVNVADITFSEDKKSAEIELSTKLIKGEYKVSIAGLTEEVLTGSVAVENEVASKIELLGTTAAVDATGANATIAYKVLNQYGEDITKAITTPEITWTSSKGTASDANGGVVTLAGGVAGAYKAGDQITLTGIVSSLGLVVSEKVNIGEVATVSEVTFKGIYNPDDKELFTDSTYNDFALLLEAKDQYGNKLTASDVNAATLITSSDESVIKLDTNGVTANNGIDSDELGIKLNAPTTAKEGTATIRIISKTTGQIFSYDVTVKKVATVDTISISQPAVVVAAGEKVEIPFVAVDQYGTEITKFNDLNGVVTLSNTALSNFAFKNDYVNKKAVLEFTAPTTKGSYILMAVTPSGKTAQITIEVKEAAEPTVISKVSDVKTSLSVGATTDVTVKNFVVLDQYGREVKLDSKFFTNYKIELAASDGTPDKVTGFGDITSSTDTVTLRGAVKGTEKAKATIIKGSTPVAGSEIEFNVSVIESDSVAGYEVSDIPVIYDNSNTAYAVKLDVYGTKSDGSKVAIPSSKYTVISNLTGVTETNGKLQANGVTFGDKEEVTGTITIIVDGSEGPVTLTKDIKVTNVAPKVVKISNKTAGDITFKDGVASGEVSDVNITNVLATFVYEDQYGVDVPKTPNVTITNYPSTATVSNNGKTNASISGLAAGETFNMTIVVDGLTKTIKVVAEADSTPAPTNNAPTVSNPISDETGIASGADVTVDASSTFTDADGDQLSLSADSNAENVATVSVSGTDVVITPVAKGTATITVTANDGNGGTVTETFDIVVSAKSLSLSDITITGTATDSSQTVSLASGDTLEVSSSDEGVATVAEGSTAGQIDVEGVDNGTATITVKVKNANGDIIKEGSFDAVVSSI